METSARGDTLLLSKTDSTRPPRVRVAAAVRPVEVQLTHKGTETTEVYPQNNTFLTKRHESQLQSKKVTGLIPGLSFLHGQV